MQLDLMPRQTKERMMTCVSSMLMTNQRVHEYAQTKFDFEKQPTNFLILDSPPPCHLQHKTSRPATTMAMYITASVQANTDANTQSKIVLGGPLGLARVSNHGSIQVHDTHN